METYETIGVAVRQHDAIRFDIVRGESPRTLFASAETITALFDGATVLTARDTDGGFFSAGNVVRGLVTPNGAVAGLLVDLGAPSAESFRLRLSAVPTTATLYALNLGSLASFDAARALRSNVIESTRLTFSTGAVPPSHAVPEPTAALAFGAGRLVAAGAVQRRDTSAAHPFVVPRP